MIVISLFSVLIFVFTKKESTGLVSPLLKKEKVLGINVWLPNIKFASSSDIELSAKAALFIEVNSGRVLYLKNIDEKLAIASLVKVMTALIALENKSLDDLYTVSQKASEFEPDKMYLIEGEKFTLKELLYGIFLISANDAAEVIAEGTLGDREEFIILMNKKAEHLGMKNTHFVNPTGLDEDSGSSYSTAYDMVILARYLIKTYPGVLQVSQTPYIHFDGGFDRQSYDMYSGINLLTTYPGVLGFKTGYTPKAGLTLITLARQNGYEVLGVLLGSENRRDEAKELLDYSFKKLEPKK